MAINVRINQPPPVRIHGTTTFVGSSAIQTQLEEIRLLANTALVVAQNSANTTNTALIVAQDAYATANSKYDKTGGHVYGDVIVDNNLTVANTIFAITETIDAGSF